MEAISGGEEVGNGVREAHGNEGQIPLLRVPETLSPHPLPPTSRLLLADHLLLTPGSRHVGWAPVDTRGTAEES